MSSRPSYEIVVPLDGPDYESLIWTTSWGLDEEHVLRLARALRREYGDGVRVIRETTVKEEVPI